MLREINKWLVANTAQRFRMWRRTRALREEMHSIAPGELECIMGELGMSAREVDQLVAAHPGPDNLLPRRLEAMGLDLEYLRSQPALYRDLQHTCSQCRNWCKCERDLERGDCEAGMRDYCLNAHTIDALVVGKQA